ncbi:DUF445 domain-containing protein [Corticicoccus populi]|uniref:DUF445 domain-containing protein n=1 Tax=Corticicoccus populi TaxID=1812821 RepID=A0ABW5WQ16_9STAP
MNSVTLVIFMVVTGSLIAGFTNILAIKMLFKPYHAKYLFGIKLPFTPGVVPARRKEVSVKLGQIITGHLLTPEVFISKIRKPESERFIISFIDRQIQTIENEKLSISYFLERLSEGLTDKIITGFNETLTDKIHSEGDRLYHEVISDLVPEDALQVIDGKVSNIQPQIEKKIKSYITSEKGYNDLYVMVDEFIEHRGRLAKTLKLFLTKESIVESIQREVIKLSEHPKMTGIMNEFISSEYEKIKTSRVSDFMSEKDKSELESNIVQTVGKWINIERLLEKPVAEFNPALFESFKERGKYKLLDNMTDYLSVNMVRIMDKLQLAELIKEQIDSFEIEKLEELVMDVAKKEFQMITLLGFILGAVVGFVQGLIVVFL